jgi:hypothetical protein
MPITTTCPGCGAPLQVEETASTLTCHFCGTPFEVDLEGVAPSLRKSSGPPQPSIEAEPAPSPYNPPLTYEGVPQPATNPDELYNPPIPNAGPAYPPYGTPQPVPQPGFEFPSPQPRSILGGKRLWVTLAVITAILFLVSCACMVALVSQVFTF